MKLSEVSDFVATNVRSVKEGVVREAKGRRGVDTDMPATIHVMRGTEPVGLMMMPPGAEHNRDSILEAACIAADGYEADVVTVAMETWRSLTMTNPVTGEPWAQNEMSVVADEHDGVAKGWIKAAITALTVNRAGDMQSTFHPYALDRRRVVWEDNTGYELAGGYIADVIRDAMLHPRIGPFLAKAGIGASALASMGPERMRIHQDIATTRALADRFPLATGCLYAEPGSVRHQLVREAFPASRVIDPREDLS